MISKIAHIYARSLVLGGIATCSLLGGVSILGSVGSTIADTKGAVVLTKSKAVLVSGTYSLSPAAVIDACPGLDAVDDGETLGVLGLAVVSGVSSVLADTVVADIVLIWAGGLRAALLLVALPELEIADQTDRAIELLVAVGTDVTVVSVLALSEEAVVISGVELAGAIEVDVALLPSAGHVAASADKLTIALLISDAVHSGGAVVPALKTELTVLSFGAVVIDAESGVTDLGQTVEVLSEAFDVFGARGADDFPQGNAVASKALHVDAADTVVVPPTNCMPALFNALEVLVAVIV